MKLPEQYYVMILKEFNDVEKLCNEANLIEDKLYLFSASYGILNRVMNIFCDPILVFMHQILQAAHQAFAQRLATPKIPATVANSLPDEMIKALFSYLTELRLAFEKKDENNIREVLEKFANLTYATSGNGFYLYLREKLVI